MTDLADQIIHLEHDTGIRPIGEHPDHCRRCEYTAAGRGPFEVEMLMQVEAAFKDPRPLVPIVLGVAS